MTKLLGLAALLLVVNCASSFDEARQERIDGFMTRVYNSSWCDQEAIDSLFEMGVTAEEAEEMYFGMEN